ncbi:hypothetical protein L2E82_11109 [Cichorium intybus]|uniref:Uncharacterized protein n=1 Tax=Cichorium intybus TaxID=13427 RepID=A0ACB9GD41_CICIN|nr:hypothetical protein L2E82_11109 [Cichorium intybus]
MAKSDLTFERKASLILMAASRSYLGRGNYQYFSDEREGPMATDLRFLDATYVEETTSTSPAKEKALWRRICGSSSINSTHKTVTGSRISKKSVPVTEKRGEVRGTALSLPVDVPDWSMILKDELRENRRTVSDDDDFDDDLYGATWNVAGKSPPSGFNFEDWLHYVMKWVTGAPDSNVNVEGVDTTKLNALDVLPHEVGVVNLLTTNGISHCDDYLIDIGYVDHGACIDYIPSEGLHVGDSSLESPTVLLIHLQPALENTDCSELPERPSEPPCIFYMKTGKCKFGSTCKFLHPKDITITTEVEDGNGEAFTGVTGVNGIDVNAHDIRFVEDSWESPCAFKPDPPHLEGQLLVICIPPPYGTDSAWHGANLLSNSWKKQR